MKHEDQVISVELSRLLGDSGVKHPSLFSWYQEKAQSAWCDLTHQEEVPWSLRWSGTERLSGQQNRYHEVLPAYSVAELGEILPDHLHIPGVIKSQYLLSVKKNDEWRIGYSDDESPGSETFLGNEAEVRGRLLASVIKDKLIEI